jgi:hypothetical protein
MRAQSHVFVSYAKLDIAPTATERVTRLAELECNLHRWRPRVFIDELHNVDGGHAVVIAALDAAAAICVVDGPNHLTRPWPRWELARASAKGIPIYRARLKDDGPSTPAAG